MKESNILKLCMLAASECGAIVFRNNIGSYKHPDGYYIKYGVGGIGGSDLIGITHDGRFLAIECKSEKGKPTPEQLNFLHRVNEMGGIGILAYRQNDVIEALSNQGERNDNQIL